jgi:hypothetical protein
MLRVLRFLALFHFGWGGVLLLAAGWTVLSAFRTLSHVSTGTIWTKLPGALLFAAVYALPPAALGVWMGILGRRLWSPGALLHTTLFWTHGILLMLGSLAVYIGIHSAEAALISISRGGGLLSPLAWIPLYFGVPVVVLAAFSLPVALLALPVDRTADPHQGAGSCGITVAARRPLFRLLLAWVLLACAFAVVLPSIWPTSEAEKLAKQKEEMAAEARKAAKQREKISAQKKADVEALRELASKPPERTAAVLRSAIMEGRLEVMRLTDKDATSALVAANLPVAFECLDILEKKSMSVEEHIRKQGAVRSWADRERENEYLEMTNRMSVLLSLLRDVQRVPADLQPFLAQQAARKSPGRSVAIALIGKLDTPADKRIGLLTSLVTDDDRQAANAARQTLAQFGAQATTARDELERFNAKGGVSPPNGASSPLSDQQTMRLSTRNGNEGPRGASGDLFADKETTKRTEETMFLIFTNDLDHSEVVPITDPSQAHVVLDTDLGVWHPKFVLQWSVLVDYGQIKVEHQMETSLSISGRGPHLDLLEWKHHYTDWKEMKRIANNRWQSASFTADELKSFPTFDIDEVKEQVRKQLKDFPEDLDHWLKLSETCRPPFDQACGIGTSRAVIKMSTKKGADWIEIKRIEIPIPMGC